MFGNTKNYILLRTEHDFSLCLRLYTLWNYRFVVGVTFRESEYSSVFRETHRAGLTSTAALKVLENSKVSRGDVLFG